MDPFTITTSVLRITTTCIDAAKSLHDIRSAWERAPVTVSSLCSQLKLTSASLSQIQVLILGENDILKEKPDLVDTFDTTLTSCLVLSTWLDSIMQRITKGVLDGTKATWRTRFKTMWNEHEIKELVEQLHTQQGAIGVLIGLLQMDSISEIRNLVRRHEALLEEIARNTRRSRTRHSIEARSSILFTDDASSSILSKLAEDPKPEMPALGDSLKAIELRSRTPSPQPPFSKLSSILQDSKPEMLALEDSLKAVALRGRTPSPQPPPNRLSPIPKEVFNDAQSRTSPRPSPTLGRSYDESHSEALRPDLPIPNFVTVEQSFLVAKDRLDVNGVHAMAWGTHLNTPAGELSLREAAELVQIRKANDYWYYCQRKHRQKDGTRAEGLVERSNMVVSFLLHAPLLAHATKTRMDGRAAKDSLMYKTGDLLELNCIHHTVLWTARRPSRETNLPYEHINVLDIGLSGVSRKHIDSLLDFVACPHPDLVDATGDELAGRMKVLLHNSGEKKKRMWGRLFAHCRSFEDLQICSRVVEEFAREGALLSPSKNPMGMF